MLYFDLWTNVNFILKRTDAVSPSNTTDTSTMLDNHEHLEMRGETRWLGKSVSTDGLSKPVMNASDTENVIQNGFTK